MLNLGNINMAKLQNLAKLAGITPDELDQELSARRLTGISFSA